MKRAVVVLLVLLVVTVALLAFTHLGCQDERWVEDLDGQPLAQCYDDL
jgi:hypothetical protein